MSLEFLRAASHALATNGSTIGPSLIPVSEVAKILGLSARTIWRLDSGGLLPQPVKIGSSKRWRRDEILDWISAGCPPRSNWQWELFRRSR